MALDPTLQGIVNSLKSQHYNFSNEWIDGCAEFFRSENPNSTAAELQEFVLEQWKLADLREMETFCLPPNLINHRKIVLPGKYALQVESMLDISVSCYSQHQKLLNLTLNEGEEQPTGPTSQFKEPKTNRMWQMSLCDGKQEVKALEHEIIKSLNQTLYPGTKVLIIGPLVCRKGMLLLTERNFKVLGGEVDSLIVPNANENVIRRKLGLDLNPDPYNENQDQTTATQNGEARQPLGNNNLPPLLPPPSSTNQRLQDDYPPADPDILPWEQDAPSLSDDELIDAAVDAQLAALERQHSPVKNNSQHQRSKTTDTFEPPFQENMDDLDFEDDEDLFQSLDIEEVEQRALGNSQEQSCSNHIGATTGYSRESRPSSDTVRNSFPNQPAFDKHSGNQFPSTQYSNQLYQNQSISRLNQYGNQGAVSAAQQSSGQTLQSAASKQTYRASTQQTSTRVFQSTARQSSSQAFHSTVRPTSNLPFQAVSGHPSLRNQSPVRHTSPLKHGRTNKPSSPASKQMKLTSFIKISRPGEATSSSSGPEKTPSKAVVSPRGSPMQLHIPTSNLSNPTNNWEPNRAASRPSSENPCAKTEPSASAKPSSSLNTQVSGTDRLLPSMLCGPDDDLLEEFEDFHSSPHGSSITNSQPKTLASVEISKEPFVYLLQIEKCPPTTRTAYIIKAFVMTVVSKVSIKKEGWHLVAKISDGSATVETVFASDVVELLIGFSHQEVKAMRNEMSKNPNLKEKLVKAFERAQDRLINLNCLMRVEFPGDGSAPCVTALMDITEEHLVALRKRMV